MSKESKMAIMIGGQKHKERYYVNGNVLRFHVQKDFEPVIKPEEGTGSDLVDYETICYENTGLWTSEGLAITQR